MAGAFSVGNALPFINSVSIAIGAASTIFDIIDSKPNIDPYSSKGKKINKIKGKIEFKNVSFTYPTRNTATVSYWYHIKKIILIIRYIHINNLSYF